MGTFLFDSTVFGPVHSRRLGVSLGINLLPNDRKLCTFDCIYCECGWNPKSESRKPILPTVSDVETALTHKLEGMAAEGRLPDVITFAGNGEPTIHPNFAEIIDITLDLRNRFAPNARVAVLSNSTMLHRPEVIEALKKVDDNILKLDSGIAGTIALLNLPNKKIDLPKLISQLQQFKGQLIIQTMFLRGEYKGKAIDNTTPVEVEAWIKLLAEIMPQKVMIYSIDRDTPASGLVKVKKEELDTIAQQLASKLPLQVEVSA
jgi:wyosine [tRNA(Phe)-imidazoG37] synthetase (radical SAM superfamily)